MSHEIRTPMSVIMGMLHLALNGALSDSQRSYLQKAYSASEGLLQIINDILDFSKIEAGKLHFEEVPFELDEVLSSLADMLSLRAREKGLELLFNVAPDVPESLIGDPLRLGQVLINLAGNAVKFTKTGEVRLNITLSGEDKAHTTLKFEVVDTGVGLSKEQQSRLFQSFTQADNSTSREFGGTGLGLVISQHLVAQMGGEIAVRSAHGQGSTFSFTARFRKAAASSQHRKVTPLSGAKVLVVDDNSSAREIFAATLGASELRVATASGGEEALALLREAAAIGEPFDLVLMDWMMPGMDGVETVAALRTGDAATTPPLVMMVTAFDRDELVSRLGATGVDGILVKPVTPSRLLAQIHAVLDHREGRLPALPVARPAPQRSAKANLHGARILLAEDNAIVRDMILELLADTPLVIETASNGRQAVEMVLNGKYDAVLMDCQMPLMDGFEATRQIRSLGRFADLPIIALTANVTRSDQQRCLDAGMNEHLAKPIDVGALIEVLGRWVRHPEGTAKAEELPLPIASAMDAAPTVEIDKAIERLGGNEALFRRVASRFAESQPAELAACEQEIAASNWSAVREYFHSLRGVAGYVGAQSLVETALRIEQAIKEQRFDALPPDLATFRAQLEAAIMQLEQWLGANPADS